jgi:1-acyl-sn-glycerol-3-phosphate acyltransferase
LAKWRINVIRLILELLFIGVFLVLSIPLMVAEKIIEKRSIKARDDSSFAIIKWAFKVILFISGTKVDYIGTENIPTDRAVLYVGNHRSDFDIPLTYIKYPNPTGFVAKVNIKKLRLISIWMKYINCVFIDRDNIKDGLKAIVTSIDLVKRGISVCIFPEGTRNRTDNDLLPFKEGSLKIATKSGCPIVPMSINNSEMIFEKHFPWVKRTHVIIEYGKPIYTDQLSKEEQKSLAPFVQNIVLEMYSKNKELV